MFISQTGLLNAYLCVMISSMALKEKRHGVFPLCGYGDLRGFSQVVLCVRMGMEIEIQSLGSPENSVSKFSTGGGRVGRGRLSGGNVLYAGPVGATYVRLVVDYSHSASFCLLTDQPAEKLSRCGRRRSPRCC